MRIIVGISGASGVVLGLELLKALKEHPVETHLLISEGARITFQYETEAIQDDVITLADHYYDMNDLAAPISSGSFPIDGMVIIPCSMKTLSAIAHGYADNLMVRAADVCLKENRRVVLVPRETPLGKVHLKNMLEAADNGCAIIPPMLTFYNSPHSLQDQIDHLIGKILMQFGLEHGAFKPWPGKKESDG
ncbi:MAG: UbiX family flavin prenyltransferase [Syntrophomonadaceae bacterium]|nr:UbiX family flavin prenyltransferase [Syntrophomonadaceae bacterium]